jgi:carbonic anhydrase
MNKPITVEQAQNLKEGDTVYINYNNPRHGEVIQTYGTVKSIPNGEVQKNIRGQEYVWVSVEYKYMKFRADKKTSVFSSLHLER